MFNSSLKKDALTIHKNAVERYNASQKEMTTVCKDLYEQRKQAVSQINRVTLLVNSIANKPKEFDTQMGQVRQELLKFKQTEEYAEEALQSEIKSGIGIAAGAAAGGAFASMAPTAAMSIATTFGTASTGTAISALHGAAATKAALAWLGGGALSAGGGGIAAGQAFLAMAGPIGWGISAAATSVSLVSLSAKNKKISDEAIEEAKKIMAGKSKLDETTARVNALRRETSNLCDNLAVQFGKAVTYQNADYHTLGTDERFLLGSVVNNTVALAVLVNRTVG